MSSRELVPRPFGAHHAGRCPRCFPERDSRPGGWQADNTKLDERWRYSELKLVAYVSGSVLTRREQTHERVVVRPLDRLPLQATPVYNVLWAETNGEDLELSYVKRREKGKQSLLAHASWKLDLAGKDAAKGWCEAVMAAAYNGKSPPAYGCLKGFS